MLLIPFYFIFQPQPPFCMQCEVLALAFLLEVNSNNDNHESIMRAKLNNVEHEKIKSKNSNIVYKKN